MTQKAPDGVKLVHVVPIMRGIGTDSLSYFATNAPTIGSIIRVPIRKKDVPAIVSSIENVKDAKVRLKSSSYSIKKISTRTNKIVFSSKLVTASERAAEYYSTNIGVVLHSIIPKVVLNNLGSIKISKDIDEKEKNTSTTSEKVLLQTERLERVEQYKNLVREEFARKKSIFICAPSIQDIERLQEELSRGIEKYTISIHGSFTKKETIKKWNIAVSTKHPVLVIGTTKILSIQRNDLGTIILEREQSGAYRIQERPFMDMRIVSEFVAQALNVRLLLADMPLRVESIHKFNKGEYSEFFPLRSRIPTNTKTKLIDMREIKESFEKKKTFTIIGTELKEKIIETIDQKGHVLAFAARRGLSPITVCGDCRNVVTCDVTGAPVVLHKGKKENLFVCHASGTVRSAHERCRHCGSWKLQSLGIGTELVYEEIKNIVPEANIFIMDSDHVKTHAHAKKVSEKFFETKICSWFNWAN